MRSIFTHGYFVFCELLRNTAHIQDSKAADKMGLLFLLPRTLFWRQTKNASFLKKLSPHAAVCRMWWDASPKLSRKGRLAG